LYRDWSWPQGRFSKRDRAAIANPAESLPEVVDRAAEPTARLPVADVQLEAGRVRVRCVDRYHGTEGIAGRHRLTRVEVLGQIIAGLQYLAADYVFEPVGQLPIRE
jgi:hypothetical protein